MPGRLQRTIEQPVEACGVGYLAGRDVTVRLLPAAIDEGIRFRRVDLPGAPLIPARVEFTVARRRRTAIERDGATVELIEHVMAALAGMRIDNCTVELDGPEVPGFDGSSLRFAEMLSSAGAVEQQAERRVLVVPSTVLVTEPANDSEISYRPVSRPTLAISYHLDYGARSPIRPQELCVEITPESFLRELAFSRTFLLEQEAEALRAAGYGARTTSQDLLIFGPNGPLDNPLRAPDECVRHKILDCLGDFALLGCDVEGHFSAYRSGHHLNREIVRKLLARAADARAGTLDRAA
jgi:UDP-3-O-acyl N-acetylglucosamine deacetylase